MTAQAQHTNVRIAAAALADLTRDNQIIVAHGNGPQVGLMALHAASFAPGNPWPLDVLGAEPEGMIGYLIEHDLMNALPPGSDCATLLTRVDAGVCVICAGGGGIRVEKRADGIMEGVEAVIDKDRTAALLARHR